VVAAALNQHYLCFLQLTTQLPLVQVAQQAQLQRQVLIVFFQLLHPLAVVLVDLQLAMVQVVALAAVVLALLESVVQEQQIKVLLVVMVQLQVLLAVVAVAQE
jgi:hypothetical protein